VRDTDWQKISQFINFRIHKQPRLKQDGSGHAEIFDIWTYRTSCFPVEEKGNKRYGADIG
jgi:hypothetical protein